MRLPGRNEDLGLPGSGGRLGAEEYDAFSLIVTVDSNSPPDTSHANSSFLCSWIGWGVGGVKRQKTVPINHRFLKRK